MMHGSERDDEKESLLFAQNDYFHMDEPDDMSVSPSASTGSSIRNRKKQTYIFSNFTSAEKEEDEKAQTTDPVLDKEESLRYLMNDVDQTNYHDLMFSTLDKIEDNFDEQAYEDLIPLNIRMALESKVFGWNHLYSSFLGHVLFPVLAYTITFWIVSLIGLKYDSEQSHSTSTKCDFFCMMHKPYSKDHTGEYVFVPIFGFSLTTFSFFRIFFSLNSALNAFRTVRRRRKVWLHSYGTAEYFKENGSRKEVLDHTDKNTVLGGIRSGVSRRKDIFLARRVERKIRKATSRFERRQQRRRKKFITDGIAMYENDHHERVQLLSGNHPPVNREKKSKKRGRNNVSKLGGNTGDLSTHDEFEDERDDTENEIKGIDGSNHFYGLTMPTFALQSIAHDQIPFSSGLIQNVAYSHGGFFGAAPFMVANPYWIDILRRLMPDVYVEISRRVIHTPIPQLIHWAENNPVVAAYGTAHELEYCGKVPTLEWDVFLDPHLVQRVEVVVNARDDFLSKLSSNSRSVSSALKSDGKQRRYTDKMSGVATLLEPNERSILCFYNTEIQKRVELLIENMLIAHGNLSQLALEQTGYLKRFNFSRVKHTRRTLGGGMFAKHWIPIFAEALKLSVEMDSASTSVSSSSFDSDVSCEASNSDSDNSSIYERHVKGPLDKQQANCNIKKATSFQNLSLAAVSTSTIASSVSMLKKLMKCDAPLGLILDFKSRHVPRRVWALIIDTLRNFGMRVEGIGSFITEEIRDISQYCSAPVTEIIFLHSAGDLQQACHSGKVKRGDSVFFNAGSLFWNFPIMDKKHVASVISTACSLTFDSDVVKGAYKFQPYARIIRNWKADSSTEDSNRVPQLREDEDELYVEGSGSTVQQYMEYLDLSIGMYVQEFAIDDRSIDLIVDYVNRYPHVYNLGLSWGGVNGVTVRGIQPGRLTNTDGFWNQRYAGERWDLTRNAPDIQLTVQ